ncbi:MAG: zinc-binding alcohol dehydrogenase family protein [Bacteroidia bacterium]
MKAVVLHPKGIFKIEEVTKPQIRPHQVLIKVEGFGLNFADVMARKGLYREAPPLPSILGYDVVGEVVEQGNDVPENLIGKRVVAMTRFGGYAEFAATDYRAVAEIPKDYPLAEALALATQYCTAYFCLHEKANIYEGDNVLIHAAAGGIGVSLTQLAKLKGCKIYGTCGSDEKINFILKNGVDVAVNYRKIDYQKEIHERIHASFNAVGGNTLKKDIKLLSAGGTLICFGAASRTDKKAGFFSNLNLLFSSGFYNPLFLMMRSKSVVGVNMLKLGDYRPNALQNTLKEVVKLANNGKIQPHSGGVFSVNDISKAHSLLENRNSIGKIAVKW